MANGMHKPNNLLKRQERFIAGGLVGKSGYKKPGSNKKS